MDRRPITIITQARVSSTRLPRKVLLEMCGKPMLWWHLSRLLRSKLADRVVVATTDEPDAEAIVAVARDLGIRCFRGSLTDVLARYHGAAEMVGAGTIVRVTSDCPLIDPAVIDEAITAYLGDRKIDYCSLDISRYPRGLDCEVMTRAALDAAVQDATEPDEREHVTPYIRAHPERFGLKFLAPAETLPNYRWCVDTPEDFERAATLLQEVGTDNPGFSWRDLARVADRHPEWWASQA